MENCEAASLSGSAAQRCDGIGNQLFDACGAAKLAFSPAGAFVSSHGAQARGKQPGPFALFL
jgi:hypothetical protein